MGLIQISEQTNTLVSIRIVAVVASALIIYTIYGAVYRLFLSPIAHIPGPWFAKLTFWNEFYYDVFLGGQYTFKLRDYHRKYGPVVRINPYEVHIMDSEFFDTLYIAAGKGRSDKWYWSMRMLGEDNHSAFVSLEHEQHRMRREPWNPYFSKASVSKLHPLLIQGCIDNLIERLAEYQAAGRDVVIENAYDCLNADIISEYCFPQGYGLLHKKPDFSFSAEHLDSAVAISKLCHSFKQFTWLPPLLHSLPLWILKRMSADAYAVVKEQQAIYVQTCDIAAKLGGKTKADYKETTGRLSMMETFMTSPALPPHEKLPERIAGEAFVAMVAGSITTTHALKTATYHILANPPILSRLLCDLEAAIPDPAGHPPDLRTLERIDYLVAVMYESLRVFIGVSHRMARIFPDRPIIYKGKGLGQEDVSVEIPPGNPVSMTPMHVLQDESIFPDQYKFNPDRWLPLQTNGVRLQKYLVTFGKGSRSCVGMELGKANFLTTLARVFLRYGRSMQLVDTVRERDIDCTYDGFNALTSPESIGLVIKL